MIKSDPTLNAASAPYSVTLGLCGMAARIQSDSRDFVDLFATSYRHFVVTSDGPHVTPHLAPHVAPDLVFTVLTSADNAWGKPVLITGDEVWPMDSWELVEQFSFDRPILEIGHRLRSHLFIHAGVVSYRGKGILLVGESTYGKTTLVLELVRRGFSFLSDEMAILRRTDHSIEPFPRLLHVRQGTLDLLGYTGEGSAFPRRWGKTIVDAELLFPGSSGESVPLDYIFLLHDPTAQQPEQGPPQLWVWPVYLDEDLLDSVRTISGVCDVTQSNHLGYPLLHLWVDDLESVSHAVEKLFALHRIPLLSVRTKPVHHPTFQAAVVAELIPAYKAVEGLLDQMLQTLGSVLLEEEFGGDPLRLFLELSGITAKASCHRLSVGPLHDMADAICALVA